MYRLGIVGQANGGGAKMAIYADVDTNGVHSPGALLAAGNNTLTIAANVKRDTAHDETVLVLQPGTSYWVAAVVTSSPTLYEYVSTPTADYRTVWVSVASFANYPPDPFPTSGRSFDDGRELSLYMTVQATP
jgi:hypothetical protein